MLPPSNKLHSAPSPSKSARSKTALRQTLGRGEHFIWFTGAALAICLLMIVGLVAVVLMKGAGFFWPHPLTETEITQGTKVLGVVTQTEKFLEPSSSVFRTRSQFKVGNRDLYGADFRWLDHADLSPFAYPKDAITLERQEYGDFYGYLRAVKEDGTIIARGPQAWTEFKAKHASARRLAEDKKELQKSEIGDLNHNIQTAELRIKRAQRELQPGPELDQTITEANAVIAREQERFERLKEQVAELQRQANRYTAIMETTDGQEKEISLAGIVRGYKPNAMSLPTKMGHYISKVYEFVADEPRESNTEGGIFPAIFGTVMMTLIMSVAVVPFGVLAAFYLREYAQQGAFVRAVRIAVNNLAGVPSIVFGVFGLGFFVYFVGGTIDHLFYPDLLPTPTYGTGGILWASLTLALLTVPVVIVATEESIAAVPRGAKEGSLALGASKFQTICKVVLPASLPGILTGLILAVARGAGEVAPLMITGVVKLAPALPLDGHFPFLHLDRKFMHLGFHIYDVGFQSPNVEAAKPMVFTTALLLLLVVGALNLAAVLIREKIRKKYQTGAFA